MSRRWGSEKQSRVRGRPALGGVYHSFGATYPAADSSYTDFSSGLRKRSTLARWAGGLEKYGDFQGGILSLV